MGLAAFILIGLCTCFNFVVIIRKWRLKRYFDTIVDLVTMVSICFVFSGTFSALVVGMIASMGVSIYLYFKPITLKEAMPVIEDDEYENDWYDED